MRTPKDATAAPQDPMPDNLYKLKWYVVPAVSTPPRNSRTVAGGRRGYSAAAGADRPLRRWPLRELLLLLLLLLRLLLLV